MSQLRARLGVRVRELRRALQMTQEELAEKAGLSYKFIGEIERGQGNPTVDTLVAISAALEVDITELFAVPEGRRSSPLYLVPQRDLHRVREALDTLEDVVRHVAPSRPRRRAARRTP